MGLDEPVHSDVRGDSYRFDIDGIKFNIVFTKAGFFRGGDIHPTTQYFRLLKGEAEVTMRKEGKDIVKKAIPNEILVIPPNTPHLFKSLTDSWIVEWVDGEFKAEYYEPYRKRVKEQFE